MSFALTATSLSGATAGTTGSVDWTQIAQSAGFPDPDRQPHIQFFNESPCELQLNFSTGEQVMLPAGGWQTLALNAQCTRLTYQVLAVLNAAPIISDLFGTWYAPGEAVPQITTLGNSPIGGSTTTVTTQSNELTGAGQTLGVTEVDTGSGPSLVPFSGANAKLLLGALDGAGNPTTLATLDAIANTVQINAQELVSTNTSAGMEWGSTVSSNTPFIDFHSSGFANDWDSRIIANGGTNVNSQGTLEIASKSFQVDGNISSVGGQTTAGSLGVSAVVAQAALVANTVTTDQQILSFSPTVAGFYRANLYFSYRNGTPGKPIAYVKWNDTTLGNTGQSFFMAISSSSAGQILIGTETGPGANQSVACMPVTVYAGAATAIHINFQDPAGTPNSVVSATIERLS